MNIEGKKQLAFTLAEGGRSPLLCVTKGAQDSPLLVKWGFTLAEVLITLGVIGVVAAVTLSSVKHIRYAGYAEKFLKTYSEIQQAHASVVQKYGEPQNWPFTDYVTSSDNSGSETIASWYMDEFQTVKRCPYSFWAANECRSLDDNKYPTKYLNSDSYNALVETRTTSMVLKDGRYIAIGFSNRVGTVSWGMPKMFFMVDVNGRFTKPNQVGRDIFFIAFEQNQQNKYVIRPFYKT